MTIRGSVEIYIRTKAKRQHQPHFETNVVTNTHPALAATPARAATTTAHVTHAMPAEGREKDIQDRHYHDHTSWIPCG